MREIKVKQLNCKDFDKYGTFALMPCESVPHIKVRDRAQFYRDLYHIKLGDEKNMSYSICKIGMRNMVVDTMEYHDRTEEGIVPLDDDIVIFCAPANNGEPEPDKIEAFFVPKHTCIVLKAGVWHFSPYVCNVETGHILIQLPERTYMNDCIVKKLPESDHISIKL
ncbi:MAG: DUF4867 family protein [Tissierellaceae bacterium]|nr:DUF4867 family protein [Tissierellaceae bacterium]